MVCRQMMFCKNPLPSGKGLKMAKQVSLIQSALAFQMLCLYISARAVQHILLIVSKPPVCAMHCKPVMLAILMHGATAQKRRACWTSPGEQSGSCVTATVSWLSQTRALRASVPFVNSSCTSCANPSRSPPSQPSQLPLLPRYHLFLLGQALPALCTHAELMGTASKAGHSKRMSICLVIPNLTASFTLQHTTNLPPFSCTFDALLV